MAEQQDRTHATHANDAASYEQPERRPQPPILRYFEFDHLPVRLQRISAPFHTLAHGLVEFLPPSAELSAGLRKLLEAKDCAVRAALTD